MNTRGRSFSLIIAALCIGFVEIGLLSSEIGEKLELSTADVWFSVRGKIEAPQDVVLLALDEASYSALNVPLDQAWPRAVHAQVIRELARLGVKRVAMDIVFREPGTDPQVDLTLAEAMKSVPTLIGIDRGKRQQWMGQHFFEIDDLLEPAPIFANAARKAALVLMPEDHGYFRRFVLSPSVQPEGLSAMYEAAVEGLTDHGDRPGPRDFIRYYGPPGTIQTYSYHTVLDRSLPPGALKGRVVFIGLNLRTALGPAQKDSFRIPFEGLQMFGVEIQATAAANLLDGRWIRRNSDLSETIALFFLTVLITILSFSFKPQWGAVLVAASGCTWAGISYAAFVNGLFLPGITLFLVLAPLTYTASTLVYYLTTYRAQQKVERAFGLYLPPQMARQMRQNPNALKLGGEKIRATAMFTDIADFTSSAERMESLDVANMLNEYFTEVAHVVFDHQGTLIKFIGDAVFAVYGAPLPTPNRAALACETALKIQEVLKRFDASGKFPPLRTRIGIATGDMVVGNLGSVERFDYTAIGDTVNLSSRLEGVNKYLGTSIIICDQTASEIRETALEPIQLAKVRVAGRQEAIAVFTLNDGTAAREVIERWDLALSKLWSGDFDGAKRWFLEVERESGLLSNVTQLYLKEISGQGGDDVSFSSAGEIVLSKK